MGRRLKVSRLLRTYCTTHIIVNVGMKSIPGMSSSINEKIPPIKPFRKPNMRQKIKADTGAQTSSPTTGSRITALPIKSISRQEASEGKGFWLMGSYLTVLLKSSLFKDRIAAVFSAAI